MKFKRIACGGLLSLAAVFVPAFGVATPAEAADRESSAADGGGLTGEVLYQFLLAEIAAQRGQLNLSAQTFLSLAKSTRDPRIAQRATEVALQARQGGLALDAAGLWLDLEPDSAQAEQTVTALLVNQGKLDEAAPHLKRLLTGSGRARIFLQLNGLMQRHQDKAAVLALIHQLAVEHPELPEARYALAQAALNAKQPELAIGESAAALMLKPDWDAAAILHGQALGQGPGAVKFYKDYISRNPKASDVRLNYARLLAAQKDFAGARSEFQSLLEAVPNNPDLTLAVALLSLQLNDFDSAEIYLQQALALGYKDPDAVRFSLGQLYEERKRDDEAIKWYKSVEPGEHYFSAHVRVAAVLAKQNRLAEGRAYLRGLNVQNEAQRLQLVLADAQLLREAKAYKEAFDVLTEALAKQPDSPELLYDRAMAAEKLNRLDVLEEDLRKLIRIRPDNAHAYNALGYTLADRTDRLQEARELIEKAYQLAPDDPFILDSLGWVHYRLGDLAAGVGHLRKALAQRPDPEIAAHLGEVLWVQGSRDEAERIWDAALREHPGNEVLTTVIKKFKP